MLHKKNLKHMTWFLMVVAAFLLLTSCATQPGSYSSSPGFFMGVLHGMLVPLSLIGSIFMDIRIYAFPNSGFFYDLGYVLGILFLSNFIIGGATGKF